ncbi:MULTISPECIES: tyrosine-type recombinase/integrase [Asaia]|uniref:Tyrosine-type recombinase/integrase n=1 Tax=Asaia spathodeae TaxID=657016 RepID=A0ABX2P8T4_9PROT|nr:site-specific integrase [Asaia spathodeae]
MSQISISHRDLRPSKDDAPFAEERRRYLDYFAQRGASLVSLRFKRNELIWIATRIHPNAPFSGVGIEELRKIAAERQQVCGGREATQRIIGTGKAWLKFLLWWREPAAVFKYSRQIDEYVRWMRDERGFSLSTIEVWARVIRRFLHWCVQQDLELVTLRAKDMDAYFVSQASGRWSRVSVANISAALRSFIRYAEGRGICAQGLAEAVCAPRLYKQETLPYAPAWSDVQRMLEDVDTDNPQDIRDRAILLLLAVYGMRSGEVAALRLDQIDWAGKVLRLFRLKRRQPQSYPLILSVAEALARYVDTVRPRSSCPEVFLCMQAPIRPFKAGSIYHVANRRFVARGINVAHRGGHALRHACASRLLAEGLSIKEIGDHLGHSSATSTSIYAKVELAALRQIAAFDLGDLP